MGSTDGPRSFGPLSENKTTFFWNIHGFLHVHISKDELIVIISGLWVGARVVVSIMAVSFRVTA